MSHKKRDAHRQALYMNSSLMKSKISGLRYGWIILTKSEDIIKNSNIITHISLFFFPRVDMHFYIQNTKYISAQYTCITGAEHIYYVTTCFDGSNSYAMSKDNKL